MSANVEPSCWNCGVLARHRLLHRDGAQHLCVPCQQEIESVIDDGQALARLSEAASEAMG